MPVTAETPAIASTQIDTTTFENALTALKAGKKVTRLGWNNQFIWLELQRPDENSKMTLPYIYMVKGENKFPCEPSCESLLAEDWFIFK